MTTTLHVDFNMPCLLARLPVDGSVNCGDKVVLDDFESVRCEGVVTAIDRDKRILTCHAVPGTFEYF